MLGNYFISSPTESSPVPGGSLASAISDSTISIGQPIYMKSSGNIDLAAAIGFPQALAIGIAINNISAGGICYYSTDGIVGNPNWSSSLGSTLLVPGVTYYLSSIPGQITTTPPDTGFETKLGKAISGSALDIEINTITYDVYEADISLSALRLVALNEDSKLIYADATLQILPIGIIESAVTPGNKIRVIRNKIISDNSWNWTPNKPIFLGDNGVITETPSMVGLLAPVGRSVSAKTINFDVSLEYYYL